MRYSEINRTILEPGLYKRSSSGFVDTWDMRLKYPNKGEYLTPEIMHTIQHTLESYMRYRYGDYRFVGVFPMACQTGFYVLTRFISKREIYIAIANYTLSVQRNISVPGANEISCSQYGLHNLRGAKDELLMYYEEYLRYQDAAINYNIKK